MSDWEHKTCPSIEVKIFIAGDVKDIHRACRRYCNTGFCVSVKEAHFIFKWGFESGAEITLINYPRFPLTDVGLHQHAVQLARLVAEECSQGSYTITGPLGTELCDRRGL